MGTHRTALVTGGTGFVGAFLIDHLLRHGTRVVALVRGPEPAARLDEALGVVCAPERLPASGSERLRVVEGDVRTPGLGLGADAERRVAAAVDEIWHCASSFKFQEHSRDEVVAHNVTGTENVLALARECAHGAAPVFYVSTAYAAPVVGGVALEEVAPADTPSRNLYEWSKQEAERLVQRSCREDGLAALILRPSIVVGHSQTGRAIRFTGYYDVTRAIYTLTHGLEVNLGAAFDRDLHLRILARPEVRLNVVPIDFVTEAMWRLSRRAPHDGRVFHIVNEAPPLLADLFRHACAPLGVRGIELVPAEEFEHRPMSGLERIFSRKTSFQAPYLLEDPRFESTRSRSLVPASELPCPEIDEDLLRRINHYCYFEVLDRQFKRTRDSLLPETAMLGSAQPRAA